MSLGLPCLGDFYLGHRLIASSELFGMLFGWMVLIGLVVDKDFQLASVGIALAILLLGHVMDAALTHHVASKGLISVRNAWGRKGQPPITPEPIAS